MCGIAGVCTAGGRPVSRGLLLEMAGELAHRGPDGVGLYVDGSFGMVSARLAVVDVEGGHQPLCGEHGRSWVVQNGEIYNHVELRRTLERLGHVFATRSDTEVIVHAYEAWGAGCLERMNGDFAFAVWDRRRRELFVARDRFGVRPLYLADVPGGLCFASEPRALLRHPAVPRELDPGAFVDTFTTWSLPPGRSAFRGVRELPPAHWLLVRADGSRVQERWWDLPFRPGTDTGANDDADARAGERADELRSLLADATRLRLRADVTVGAYLSGGLDSSGIAALARQQVGDRLACFGVTFDDADYDESRFQQAMAARLDVDLVQVRVTDAQVAELFAEAVVHAQQPTMRTALAPMLRLSRAVRDAGIKVVLTGEGADELFAGYEIFQEQKIRRFWAEDPSSPLRPLLLRRLYPDLARPLARSGSMLSGFFGRHLTDLDDPLYSHRIRFENTARCLRLLSDDARRAGGGCEDALAALARSLPDHLADATPLGRAQYLEIATFLTGYLLHVQGDRMLMASSVEGRFPYLDHRVAELAASLPDGLRLRRLEEKHILRRALAPLVPDAVRARKKRPYRAPILRSLFGPGAPEWVPDMLEERRLARAGLFDPRPVGLLADKARLLAGRAMGMGETDEMALVGVLSGMLLHHHHVEQPSLAPAATPAREMTAGDEPRATPDQTRDRGAA